MKSISTVVILIFVFLSAFSQNIDKGVQIKILHKKNVILDTVIFKQGNEAIVSIENIVSLYTDNPVYIDASEVRGLYVFSFETLKSRKKPKIVEPLVVNIDSIMNSIITKIEKVMNDSTVNAVKDSINQSFKEMKQAIKAIDKEDVKRAKDDFKEFVDKVKETRVIIIQEGDTIIMPSGKKKEN